MALGVGWPEGPIEWSHIAREPSLGIPLPLKPRQRLVEHGLRVEKEWLLPTVELEEGGQIAIPVDVVCLRDIGLATDDRPRRVARGYTQPGRADQGDVIHVVGRGFSRAILLLW